MDAAIIEKQALLMPDFERALLADRLLQSLSPIPLALRDAWVAEADTRMEAFRTGNLPALDGADAFAELRARFTR